MNNNNSNNYLHIYFFIWHIPNPATTGSARIIVNEREKKERKVRRAKKKEGSKGQRVKLPIPTWAIDILIGNDPE